MVKEKKKATKKTTKKAPARKRARTKKWRFVADNPDTPHNEAWGEIPSMKKYIGIGSGVLLLVLLFLSQS